MTVRVIYQVSGAAEVRGEDSVRGERGWQRGIVGRGGQNEIVER